MINGVYRFYQNGELVGEHKNLITTEGSRLVLRYLAGQSPSLGGAIAVGVSATAATTADTRLGFEISRQDVELRNADYVNTIVVFKGTIPQEESFKIYESGLWSTAANNLSGEFESKILTTFDFDLESWTNVTLDTTQQRTGVDAAKVTVSASSTVSPKVDVDMDLSGYSANDTFLLAFYKPDNNITTIKMVFEDTTTGGSFNRSVTISALPVGYNVISFRKGDFTATGTVSWSSINRMGFDVTAGGTGSYVILDAVRIEDTDTPNQEYILVSHSVLGSPITKTNVAPMDIEYALDFTIS